jgi:hypothetical protein
MIIKKWSGTAWVAQSPKVNYADIVTDVTAGSPVSIFPNGKLNPTYLPDSIFSGLTFVGTVALGSPTSPFELKRFVTGTPTSGYIVSSNLDTFTGLDYSADEYAGIGQRYIGHYWVMAGNVGIFDSASSTPESDWDTAVFDEGVAPALAGGLYADNINLETGDWVLITGWDNSTKTFLFRIINNSLKEATHEETGTIKLGSSTVQTVAANTVSSTSSRSYAVQKNSSGQAVVNVPWASYSTATASIEGLIQLGSNTEQTVSPNAVTATAGRTYALQLMGDNKAVVNVPWANTDTTYDVLQEGGLALDGNEFHMVQPIIIGTATPNAARQTTNNLWFDIN